MNIALVTVDSLRADHTGIHGYERDTTPNLDSFGSDAHTFVDTVSHACATRPSFPSLLTSTHGLLYGGFDHLAEEQIPISVPLSDAGYTTGGFHSNPYLSAEFGYDRGFDVFSDSEEDASFASKIRRYVSNNVGGRLHDALSWFHTKAEEHTGVDVGSYYQDAKSLTDEALNWVNSAEEPWFLWVHYMDPHHPYVPPAEHQVFGKTVSSRRGVRLRQKVLGDPSSLTEADWADLIALYDAEIRYTDAEIGRLLGEIDDAVWAITADHGEEFYEHGGFGHKNRFYEEHVHVPFLLGGVGINETDNHHHLVGLNDIPVTLLEVADIAVPDSYRGYDARQGNRDRVLGGWAGDVGTDLNRTRLMSRTNSEKYIRDVEASTEELYDLTTDPGEQTNLFGDDYHLSNHIEAVDGFFDTIKSSVGTGERVEIDYDIQTQLEHLGYK